MKQPPRQRPFKDERDEQIETNAKSYALEWVTAVTQILTVVPQNKIPVSCAKTANYNRIFINLSLTVCQKNGTLFFLCVSEISVIVVLVATDKKRERTTPTTARSFSHP